jgi:Uncharacterised nucleotidyltransferase
MMSPICRRLARIARAPGKSAESLSCDPSWQTLPGGASSKRLAPGELNVWERVDRLIERADSVADLHTHRLHLYAAWRWRQLGRPLPRELVELERGAAVQRLSVPAVLRVVREAYEGPIVLLKGADVAACYPRPELRPSLDLDLLVPDAETVQRRLVERGFRERLGITPDEHHHGPQLEWPGLAVRVEIHGGPNWPTWLTPPPTEEVLAGATSESALGHGIRALAPAHHTLILVAHAWREVPLSRLGHIVDIMLLGRETGAGELDALARRWGLQKLWTATDEVARRVLLGEATGRRSSRIWVRRLESVSRYTVLEAKLAELVAPFWAVPAPRAAIFVARALLSELTPAPRETWREKLRRTADALRDGLTPRSERDHALDQGIHGEHTGRARDLRDRHRI